MEMLMKRQQRRIRLKNVIVFTEAIFGKEEWVFGLVRGPRVRGGGAAHGRLVGVCVLQLRVFLHQCLWGI